MALSCCCGSPNPPSQHGAARPSPITAVQDVAVNVVGKYRYRMTSPADSTWVPLIIDIILVGSRGVDNCWCLVVAAPVPHTTTSRHTTLLRPVRTFIHLAAAPCQWLQEPVLASGCKSRLLCLLPADPQVGRTKIITLHSGIWLENQIDM